MKERVCKRFISMPDSDKPERLEIVQAANGKYFNHYGMDGNHWCANAGAFDSLLQAIEVLKKHRPDVVEKWWYSDRELNEMLIRTTEITAILENELFDDEEQREIELVAELGKLQDILDEHEDEVEAMMNRRSRCR